MLTCSRRGSLLGFMALPHFTNEIKDRLWKIYPSCSSSWKREGLNPIVKEKFALLEARKANELLESGKVTGNIALLTPELLMN